MSMQEMAAQRLWSINATMLPSSEDAGRMELIAASQSQQRERAWQGHFICIKQVIALKGPEMFSSNFSCFFSELLLSLTMWLFRVSERKKSGEKKNKTLHIRRVLDETTKPSCLFWEECQILVLWFHSCSVASICTNFVQSNMVRNQNFCFTTVSEREEKEGCFSHPMYRNYQTSQVQIGKTELAFS